MTDQQPPPTTYRIYCRFVDYQIWPFKDDVVVVTSYTEEKRDRLATWMRGLDKKAAHYLNMLLWDEWQQTTCRIYPMRPIVDPEILKDIAYCNKRTRIQNCLRHGGLENLDWRYTQEVKNTREWEALCVNEFDKVGTIDPASFIPPRSGDVFVILDTRR